MTKWEKQLELIREVSSKAKQIIEDNTIGISMYHDSQKPIVNINKTLETFIHTPMYIDYIKDGKKRRKQNPKYNNKSGIFCSFKPRIGSDIYGRVKRTDIIDSMHIMGCCDSHLDGSIEFIEWDNYYLMVVNSRCFIGSYKAFVDKDCINNLIKDLTNVDIEL